MTVCALTGCVQILEASREDVPPLISRIAEVVDLEGFD